MAMSLREWSLRLGLLSTEADERGDWSLREIGQPQDMREFNEKEAWELIGVEGVAPFKTSESTTREIADPTLRLAHYFLVNNLLGHINTTITTIELYFMWCMIKKIKVHLGYWLAHSYHKIAHRSVRHLYACHLVGAYLIRNVMPKMIIPVSSIEMCEDPEWFDISYFVNLSMVERKGNAVVLCDSDKSREVSEDKTSEESDKPEESAGVHTSPEKPQPTETEPEAPKERSCSTKEKSGSTEEKRQRIIEFMMQKFRETDEKQRTVLELQIENMNQALSLIERMTNLAEQNNQLTLQLLSAASALKGNQPQETATTSQPPSGVKKARESDSSGSQKDN